MPGAPVTAQNEELFRDDEGEMMNDEFLFSVRHSEFIIQKERGW